MGRLPWACLRVVLICFALISCSFSQNNPGLRIDESQIKFRLQSHPLLEFPVINTAGKSIEGSFRLELINTNEVVQSAVFGTFQENPGITNEKLAWPLEPLLKVSPSTLGWYRLRYEFNPDARFGVAQTKGIVQLSRMLIGSFEIRMTAAGVVKPGSKFPVRLRVDDPNTGQPFRAVLVEVAFEIGSDDDKTVKRTVKTDYNGYASCDFEVPKDTTEDEGSVTATAKRAPFSEEAKLTFQLWNKGKLTLTTDKPLYQPGQSAHMRMIAFGPDRRILKNGTVVVEVEDENGNVQFHQKLQTSRFGIATADWEIPQKLLLGDYKIEAAIATNDDVDYDSPTAHAKVRVSRYDLPTFTVSVDPDRKYYLPGEEASINVKADYLFGKSVREAKVRLVRQQSREWNFKEQKWTSEESEPIVGSFNDGKFTAKLNLDSYFSDFDPAEYDHYEDLTFAAFVTDLSTNRTEQRRFRLRLSKQPIQLYVIGSDSDISDRSALYVTSSYADGTPASVNGTLYLAEPNNAGKFEKNPWDNPRSKLLKFQTNRYGIAKILLPRIADRFLIIPEWQRGYYLRSVQDSRSALFLLQASDKAGREGRASESWEVSPGSQYLSVKTDRILFHPREPLAVEISSNSKVHDIVVDVSTRAGLIESRTAQLWHGHAKVGLDYDPRLLGEVEITAFALTGQENDNGRDTYALSGTAYVIYPALQDLQVGLRMAQTTYRPGQTASADLKVRTPQGAPEQSAVGVLVFDRAVAERVRTDEEFGKPYGFSIYDYLDGNEAAKIAGIGYRDLLSLDPDQPFTPDLQLLAELLTYSSPYHWWGGYVKLSGGEAYSDSADGVYRQWITNSLDSVRKALNETYYKRGEYPRDNQQLREILRSRGVDQSSVSDPWGTPYRSEFSVEGPNDVLTLKSDGIDKLPRTGDDITAESFQWPYFRSTGKLIDEAIHAYQARTGNYIRDYATLRGELKAQGVDLDALRDPWGHRYHFAFDVVGPTYRTAVISAGPDGIFDSNNAPSWDDVQEWTSSIHYFLQEKDDLEQALAGYFATTKQFPQTEEDLRTVIEAAKLTRDRLLDPWGRPYHFTFSKRDRYWDRLNISTYTEYKATREKKVTDVMPVTQELAYITVFSYGPDNKPQQQFEVAEFSRVVAEQSSRDERKKVIATQGPLPLGSGAITGTVTDPSGAVIPGATVIAISANGASKSTETDSNGVYLLSSLTAGLYEIQFSARYFTQTTITRVPVQMGATTALDARLNVGSATEMVEVSAGVVALQTDSASMSQVVALKGLSGTRQDEKTLFTPRVRKYFPETLVWQPEVVTDGRGQAHIEFPMADNITSWSMSVIASDEAGRVGVVSKELRTFQPFFVEHDPPKVLTEGDRISLPVVLRNYSDKPQMLLTELKPEAWFSILSPGQQHVTVPANGDANAEFEFLAVASVNPGRQRISARNEETGDAVEREIRVHPDGQEVSFTTGRVLAGGDNSIQVEIPADAMPHATTAELRIYPNLIAHVLDAIKGIGNKPSGCGEQITSTAYVSLQALQLLKKAGVVEGNASDPRAALLISARKAVGDANQLLPGLQLGNGGFAYWNQKPANVSLTAYVLRFLTESSGLVDVDTDVLKRARIYLLSQQTKTGAWTQYDWQSKKDVEDPTVTAYVVRSLAVSIGSATDKDRASLESGIARALDYLDAKIDDWKDPYLVGNYAIAAIAAGHETHVANARDLLSKLAHDEGTTTYWNLEANTSPFYGWGTAGRLETTALAVEALVRLQTVTPDQRNAERINRGLQYLLTHKDPYYTWYSSQATQNVLEALIVAMPPGTDQGGASEATITINGISAGNLQLSSATEAAGPKVVELTKELLNGKNQVQIFRSGNTGAIQASVITSYYFPWSRSEATQNQSIKVGETRALRLTVNYDRGTTKIGDELRCQVEAERIGFRGYGMMVAEVGLPPGADVDRQSLERAKESGVDGYEVQPDRVVFYIWPEAGGIKFDFTLRMRYPIDAMTAPSLLYDYYNPDANATVIPVRISAR